MTIQFQSPQDLIAVGQERLPFLRASCHPRREPIRNPWVGILLLYFIDQLNDHLSRKRFTKQEQGRALELIAEYRSCLKLFSTNAGIPINQVI